MGKILKPGSEGQVNKGKKKKRENERTKYRQTHRGRTAPKPEVLGGSGEA